MNKPETFWVDGYTTKLNLAGDCNEGGYENSLITWRLSASGTPLMNSETRFQQSSGNPIYRAECVNGRFTLTIDLMDADGNVRQGLSAGNLQIEHKVEVEIFGVTTNGNGTDVLESNPALSPEVVMLQPICILSGNC